MSNENQQVGIYRLYKLGRMSGNKFDKNIKVLERTLHPVHHFFAEESNANSHINGLLYEEDKEATKKYWNKEPYESAKEYTAFKEVKEPVNTESTDSPQIAEIKNKLSEMSKEQLIEFAEKNDYKVTKTKGKEKLLLEIVEQIEVDETEE